MVSQQLLDYIHQQQQMGKSREEITHALLQNGWQAEDVEQGFASISSGVPAPVATTEMPSASKIFSEAWEIYKSRFKTLIAISLIPAAAWLVFALVFVGGAVGGMAAKVNMAALGVVGGIAIIAAVIFLIYLSVWSTVSTIYAIKDQAEGIGWKEAFTRSKPKINPFFFTGLLTGLAVLGGIILLIIPGIIFGLWFSQSGYIVIEENLANTAAMKRSKYYVKGRLGQVFGKGFYIAIITLGIYILVGIVVAGLNYLAGNYFSWLNNVFSLIWTPVATVYAYLVYKYLRATRP